MKAKILGLISMSLLVASGQTATAHIQFTSQTRQVRSLYWGGGIPTDDHLAPDFGAWAATASTEAGTATLTSDAITAVRLHADLQISIGSMMFPGSGFSLFRTEFTVLEPTPYDFFGRFIFMGQPGLSEFSLTGPSGPVFLFEHLIPDDFLASGVLEPGAYVFTASLGTTSVVARNQSEGATFVLQIPTPSGAIVLVAAGALTLRRRRPVSAD